MTSITLAVVVLAALGAEAQSAKAAQLLPPPGKLVEVGGRTLHINCTGSGTPTVVLESGASSFAIDWSLVQPAIAKTNRVCSYDRAGHGWSDPGLPERAQTASPIYARCADENVGGLFARRAQLTPSCPTPAMRFISSSRMR